MSSMPTRPLPDIPFWLPRGPLPAPPVPVVKRRGRPPKYLVLAAAKSLTPVYVSIVEDKSCTRGQLGVAAINPATMVFHLFGFVDSPTYSTLKTLLQELVPTEVITCISLNRVLNEVVKTTCDKAVICTVQKRYFKGGLEKYNYLRSPKSPKLKILDGKELYISAFAGLVEFTEHMKQVVFPASSCLISLQETNSWIICPLCDEEGVKCELKSINEMQKHFYFNHWQVHGYGCQFCGTMFPTKDELMTSHSDCEEWKEWLDGIHIDYTAPGMLKMACSRMLLCCSDCGWYTTLSKKDRMISEEGKMNYLKTFFSHHNNDGLLAMLAYFPAVLSDEVDSIRFSVTSMTGGNPLAPCSYCGPPEMKFRDPTEANEHYMREHKGQMRVCTTCQAKTTTEYLLEQHQMSHIHENSYFADYLSNSARIFPPPRDRSSAPRVGWKNRDKTVDYALGGLVGGISGDRGPVLVDPLEDVREAKAQLMKRRDINYEGYEDATVVQESEMARGVREKLMRDYADCDFVQVFNDVWLRDEDAIKFSAWMEYWESPEGIAEGRPPKMMDFHVSESLVRLPTVEVELQFRDRDSLSGFILNDNVFYCVCCNWILKGQQAIDHLKPRGLIGLMQTENKCAKNKNGIVENPIMNKNMFALFSSNGFYSAPSTSLPCPHCPRTLCSITGLRVHTMVAHGIYAKYERIESEVVTYGSFKCDIRSVPPTKDGNEGANQRGPVEVAQRWRGRSGEVAGNPQSVKRGRTGFTPIELSDEEIEFIGVSAVKRDRKMETDENVVDSIVKKMIDRVVGMLEPLEISDDEDDVMIVDDAVDPKRNMTARVREESEEIVVGGQNEPATMEHELMEQDDDSTPKQPVIREFTPEGDDDLCVVAEVENANCAIAAESIRKQREKKFPCPKCSDRFITSGSLEVHLKKAHALDAGQSTILEELGIPLRTTLWLCKPCCVAFPSPHAKEKHSSEHATKTYDCDHCSHSGYNLDVLEKHKRNAESRKVRYICGECKFSYDRDASLQEHSNAVHGVPLFYFCKSCEFGSTEGLQMYHHFAVECPNGVASNNVISRDQVNKFLGVIPAAQLHFQPVNLENYKRALLENPDSFAKPSLCNHRSLIVPYGGLVSCKECWCLQHFSTFKALEELATGQEWDGKVVESQHKVTPPFNVLRRAYAQASFNWDKHPPEWMNKRQWQLICAQLNPSTSKNVMMTQGSSANPRASGSSQEDHQMQALQYRINQRDAMTRGVRGLTRPFVRYQPANRGGRGGATMRGSLTPSTSAIRGGPALRYPVRVAMSGVSGGASRGGAVMRGNLHPSLRGNGGAESRALVFPGTSGAVYGGAGGATMRGGFSPPRGNMPSPRPPVLTPAVSAASNSYNMSGASSSGLPPLTSSVYRQSPANSPSMRASVCGTSMGRSLPVSTRFSAGHGMASVHRIPAYDEAQRRMDDRRQLIHSSRMNGAGSRPPVLTPGTVGRVCFQNGGGPSILRGNAPFPSTSRLTHTPLSTARKLSIAAQAAMDGSPLSLQQMEQLQYPKDCPQCNANLLTVRDVFIHSLHTPDRGAFVCAACPIALRDERAAIKHIVNHLDSHQRVLHTVMNCPMCGLVVPNPNVLKRHIATSHNLAHGTASCVLTFNTAALAEAHEEVHQTSDTPDGECCVLCGSMDDWSMEMVDTRGKGLIISHLMKHACKHVYYCKICDMKQFDEESQMITHFIMSHTQAEKNGRSCNQCGLILNTENEHKNHCLTKHTITELFAPNKMDVKVPETFSDFLGV